MPKYKEEHIEYVYLEFCDVMSKYIKNKSVIKELFEDVVKRYSTKSRHYHNMKHIYNMVSLWNDYKEELHNEDEVFISIIYHDIVYNTKRNDNELKSAVYFLKKVLPLMKLSQESYSQIYLAILATKHNGVFIEEKKIDNDIKFLLDFDLSVLGSKDNSEYEWYKNGVRKEYKIYPDEQYNAGRAKVLQSFLDKKKIYLTKEFKIFEKRARKNLQNEINSYICQ